MSAGTIWYKMQPNSEIARAISDLLTDFCGSIKSHDTTVMPQKLAPLISSILSRSEAVIIVGGADAIAPEENTVYLLAKLLGISLEEGRRSRSRYCFDTLHGTRLPSLAGSVLFPTRFGGPEGIVLTSGEQTVIVLPSGTRAAITAAVSIRKFLAPQVRARRTAAITVAPEIHESKDYEKFRRDTSRRQSVTREYSENQLNAAMERAVSSARRRFGGHSYDFMEDDSNRGSSRRAGANSYADDEYYQRLSKARKARNILSLVIVIGVIVALIVLGFRM